MPPFSEIASVFFLSTVKFLLGVSAALAHNFSFWEFVLFTTSGGVTGVLFFYFFGTFLFSFLRKKGFLKSKKEKKKFSYKNRKIISIKNKYGPIGIAFLTPIVLSIPVGCIISSRYFSNNKLMLYYLIASVYFWGVALAFFSFFYK